MIVRLRGINKIAKEHGLFVTAIKLGDKLYVTGQGIIPGKKETANMLTYDEMIGEKQLSEEKAARFPYIIDPNMQHKFQDGFKFDTETVDGAAILNFIKTVASDRVAHTKSEIERGKHSFYLENKVAESKGKTARFKASLVAGNAIGKLSPNELLGLADYIYVHENEPNCGRDREQDIIVGTLYDYAEKSPSKIINALKDENKMWIRVAGIVSKGVINKKNGEYYEGTVFIASNFDALVETYRTQIEKATRWDKKYAAIVKNVYTTFDEPVLDVNSIKNELMTAVLDNDSDAFDKVALTIKKSNNAELMELLIKYNSRMKDLDKTDKMLGASGLLDYVNEVPWMKFYSEFKRTYPDSDLAKKEQIIEFLKLQ